MVQFLYLIANSNQEANRQISVSFLNILFAKADLNLQHLQQIYNQFEKTPPPPTPPKQQQSNNLWVKQMGKNTNETQVHKTGTSCGMTKQQYNSYTIQWKTDI